ncbi:RluA family pseudouridine synthase [Castellaniella defragrans]|uniref:RluA family pseudouridine synthase n=1 Tax=Castellaniella defragrans TaxID=75697 RepID=UPI002AFF0AEF|nr:RluA family pseudouridine synthase [Castellaniella defragrans]
MPYTDIATEDTGPDAPEVFQLPLDVLPDRLDKTLARLMPQHSRSRLQAWIEDGHVEVDGAVGKVRTRVGPGALIRVWPQQAPEDQAFVPEDVAFRVVADAPDWIVVDKPAGLVTHPGAGNWHGTLLNGLLFRYPELARVARAGIVHRLDKDTSGLLVVARTETAQTQLVRQLQARTVRREYCALVHGALAGRGTVDAPIGRDARVPVRMSADRPVAPKPAVTHYESLGVGHCGGTVVSRVLCRLETGRTHQIRVHMARLRHPLLGDTLYGGRHEAGAGRQMLHARALGFDDPASGRPCAFTAEPPDDFRRVLDGILWDGDGDPRA